MKDTHSRHTAQRASHFCTIKLRTVHTNPHLDKEVNAEQCDQPQIDGSERTEGGQVAALGKGGGSGEYHLGCGRAAGGMWGDEEYRDAATAAVRGREEGGGGASQRGRD